jgi:response regulator of citrate/malate metabolism
LDGRKVKILIIENEVYLAQSIATKLTELGHNCEMFTSTRDAIKNENIDVVLLSTSLNSHDILPVIEHFKDAIVILMVSYISNDTVSKPLSAGAKDYIVKPFMIEELVRKIDHHQDYEKLKKKITSYEKYFEDTFSFAKYEHKYDSIKLPVFIQSSMQKNADAFAYFYAQTKNKPYIYINLSSQNAFEEIKEAPKNSLFYCTNFHTLKKNEKAEFYELIQNQEAIISSVETVDKERFEVIEIKEENTILTQGDIMPIEDYVKYIVINYQNKYPDTELSKKLGISRKSLWEKRKKYDIIKKK